MLNLTLLKRIVPIVALAVLLLAGCKETASETAKDVAEARKDASEDNTEARQDASQTAVKADEKIADAQQDYAKSVAPAREDLSEAQSDASSDIAKADFDVAIIQAEGIADVASQKCGMLMGVEKKACFSTAEATFEASKAKATAERDAALVAAADNQK